MTRTAESQLEVSFKEHPQKVNKCVFFFFLNVLRLSYKKQTFGCSPESLKWLDDTLIDHWFMLGWWENNLSCTRGHCSITLCLKYFFFAATDVPFVCFALELCLLILMQSILWLRPPLVSDHHSSATSFPKYQKFQSQITIFKTSCKRPLLVSKSLGSTFCVVAYVLKVRLHTKLCQFTDLSLKLYYNVLLPVCRTL